MNCSEGPLQYSETKKKLCRVIQSKTEKLTKLINYKGQLRLGTASSKGEGSLCVKLFIKMVVKPFIKKSL